MRAMLLTMLALAVLAGAGAQEPRPAASCPAVTISCPDDAPAGKNIKCRANVAGGDPSVTPAYKWTVPGGKIVEGQGTREVEIEIGGHNSYTVTVEVGGYPSSCSAAASTSSVWDPPASRKVDEYGDIDEGEERERLGAFAEELRKDPAARGYLVVYAGRRARKGEAAERGTRAKSYLAGTLGIDPARVFAVDGGHRESRAVELFLTPAGATPPSPKPTVKPSEAEVIEDNQERR